MNAKSEPAASEAVRLPPLPEPHINNVPQLEDENWHGYTADQMHAYARQAIEQAGSERLTDEQIDDIWDAHCDAPPEHRRRLIADAIRQQSTEGGKA